MADFYTSTVIQQTIPDIDITPLELLLLSNVFDAERDGDGWYFYSEQGPSDILYIERAALEAAIAASESAGESAAVTFIKEHLPDPQSGESLPSHLDLDLSATSWEFIMQDIVRRSSTLRYVTTVSAFTCTRMRPDGFGGMAVLITADAILGKSTHDVLEDFLSETGLDQEESAAAG